MKAAKVLVLLPFLVMADSKIIPSNMTQKPRDEPEMRIAGGDPAKEGQFQYMVLLIIQANKVFQKCTASLVQVNWVLTAAHCTIERSPKDIYAATGKADMGDYVKQRVEKDFNIPLDEKALGVQERRISKIFVPPYYNHLSMRHDLSLLWVDKPFVLEKDKISIIPMARGEMTSRTMCSIVGWGMTKKNQDTNKLQFAHNITASTPRIGCTVLKLGPYLCVSDVKKYLCPGDSGGPLVCNNSVWGVATHGFNRRKQKKDCEQSEEDYFSDLYSDGIWINRTLSSAYRSAVVSFNYVFAFPFFAAILSGYI